MKIKGIKQVKKNLDKFKKEAINEAKEKALMDVAEKIGEISKAGVPFVSGRLRNSFTVQKLGSKTVCGYNTEYAAELHQGEEGWNWSEPGTGPLYLSNSVNENEKELLQFFAERVAFYLKI